MKFIEHGYTPNNFKVLVTGSGCKSNAEFCKKFNISIATFYCYKRGATSMKWEDWQDLVKRVKIYAESKERLDKINSISL